MDIHGAKTCYSCGYSFLANEFHRAKREPDGRRGTCKLCFGVEQRSRYPRGRWQFKGGWWEGGESVRAGYLRRREDARAARLLLAKVGHCQQEVARVYAERDRLVREDGVARDVHHVTPIAHGGSHSANNLKILTQAEHREHHRHNPTRSKP